MTNRFSIVGRKVAELPPSLRAWFLDRALEPAEALCMSPKRIARYWKVHGAGIVAEYADQRPGERPAAWWRWTAPEPRKRLGGTGTPAHERLAYAASYSFGICDRFIDCDPDDLPRFESTASYLKRHNLFLVGEEKRLPADAYDEEELDDSRILRLRPMAELEAEFAARKAAGTIGKVDERFDR